MLKCHKTMHLRMRLWLKYKIRTLACFLAQNWYFHKDLMYKLRWPNLPIWPERRKLLTILISLFVMPGGLLFGVMSRLYHPLMNKNYLPHKIWKYNTRQTVADSCSSIPNAGSSTLVDICPVGVFRMWQDKQIMKNNCEICSPQYRDSD